MSTSRLDHVVIAKCAAMDMKLKLPLLIPPCPVQLLSNVRERARRLRRNHVKEYAATRNRRNTSLGRQSSILTDQFEVELNQARRSRVCAAKLSQQTENACQAMIALPTGNSTKLDVLLDNYQHKNRRTSTTIHEDHDPRDEGISVVPRAPVEVGGDWDPKMLREYTNLSKDKRNLLFDNMLRYHIELYRNKMSLKKKITRALDIGKSTIFHVSDAKNITVFQARKKLVGIELKIEKLKVVLSNVISSSGISAKKFRATLLQAEMKVDEEVQSLGGIVPLFALKWKGKALPALARSNNK